MINTYNKNIDQKLEIASMTKIMTAYTCCKIMYAICNVQTLIQNKPFLEQVPMLVESKELQLTSKKVIGIQFMIYLLA